MVQNKGLIFKSVPSGWPVPGENLAVEAREFDLDASPPKDGITTKNCYLSFDPYLRSLMRAPDPILAVLGQPLTSRGVAKVLKSDNPKFRKGDVILGMIHIEEYSRVSDEVVNNHLRKLENPLGLDPKLFIGALGMPPGYRLTRHSTPLDNQRRGRLHSFLRQVELWARLWVNWQSTKVSR